MTMNMQMLIFWLVVTALVFLITRKWRWVIWMLLIVPLKLLADHEHTTPAVPPAYSMLALIWVFITFVASVVSIVRWLLFKPSRSREATRA